jgi:hypothetical protein
MGCFGENSRLVGNLVRSLVTAGQVWQHAGVALHTVIIIAQRAG